MSDLLDRARTWAAEDPDPVTKAELEALIGEGETAELADRFSGTLEFGTAGLRGALGAGPNRMNRVVVLRAAAGLAAYLLENGAGPDDSVVIGYDARHNSDVFARDTAEVMTGAGMKAYVLPRPLPTPLLAFAIRHLGCVAGVMVTASHNPPQDNGYKVYLGDGSQIVPPADAEIAAHIDAVGPVADIPRGDGGEVLGDQVLDHYLETVVALAGGGARDLDVVYTPLHGVGGSPWSPFARGRLPATRTSAAAQAQPDPDFPTVSFPNPGIPARWTSPWRWPTRSMADIVVANDPTPTAVPSQYPARTAGRCCAATRSAPFSRTTCWPRGRASTRHSIVSSSLLGTMARSAGKPFVETLTGFKWIGRLDGLAFGYEEALGYCVDPAHVRDKDGVSAVLLICDLAARAKAAGRTLRDLLDDIAVRTGCTPPISSRPGWTDLAGDPGRRCTGYVTTPRVAGRAGRRAGRRPRRSALPTVPPTVGLRFRLADQAGCRTALGHRAQGEVLPRGRRTQWMTAGRGRRRTDLRRGRLDAIRGDLQAAAGL